LILSVIINMYFAPLFLLHNYGAGISFNMFVLGLCEILGLIASFKFLNVSNLRNGIKLNLMVCGIILFTMTFCNFEDNCDNQASLCTSKVPT